RRLALVTVSLRTTVAPRAPAVETLVRRSEDEVARADCVLRIALIAEAGSLKRTSLLPARSAKLPSCELPSAASSLPAPLEKTISLTARVAAETRTTWAP